VRNPLGPIAPANGLVRGCFWGASDPRYTRSHDEEWGFPVADDRRLFEKICLEGFQAGLSWLTILRKREILRNSMTNLVRVSVAIDTSTGGSNPALSASRRASGTPAAAELIVCGSRFGKLAALVRGFTEERLVHR